LREALYGGGGVAVLACSQRQRAFEAAADLERHTCDERVYGAPEAGVHGRRRRCDVAAGERLLGALSSLLQTRSLPGFVQQRIVEALDEVRVLQVAAKISRFLDGQRSRGRDAERKAAGRGTRCAKRPSQP
jgi:hypothetical protein